MFVLLQLWESILLPVLDLVFLQTCHEGLNSDLAGCQVRPEKHSLSHERQNRFQKKTVKIICANFLKLKVSMKACGRKYPGQKMRKETKMHLDFL